MNKKQDSTICYLEDTLQLRHRQIENRMMEIDRYANLKPKRKQMWLYRYQSRIQDKEYNQGKEDNFIMMRDSFFKKIHFTYEETQVQTG